MQSQAFGQIHLFKSWQVNIPGLERLKPVLLGEFLYGDWCRAFGYTNLSGGTPADDFRLKMQLEQGSVPTITVRGAQEIDEPNPAVKGMFDAALKLAAPKKK
jgi:hypothetical protein